MRTKNSKKLIAIAIATTIGSGNSMVSMAEDATPDKKANGLAIEEIIVTAQKREQGLQDVPVSVSVMSGDKLDETGIQSMDEFAAYVPNLQINTTAFSTVFIRGLGSDFNYGFEQSVGTYVDGLYMGQQRQIRGLLMDVDAIEVLRGPQGTLYGKNTIAGAINIKTRKPTEVFEGNFAVKGGEFGEQEIQAVVSGPLSDNLLARIAILDGNTDGYVDNRLGQDGGGVDKQNLRGTFVWQANSQLEVVTKLETGDYNTEGMSYELTEFGNIGAAILAADPAAETRADLNSSVGGFGINDFFQNTSSDLMQVTVNYDTESGYSFNSLSGYAGYTGEDSIDFDYSPIEAVYSLDVADYESRSQEFRFMSPTEESYFYIVGAYIEDTKYSRDGSYTLLSFKPRGLPAALKTPGIFEQDTSSWSAFYEGTYAFTESWSTTFGLRYAEESKDAIQGSEYFDLNDNKVCAGFNADGTCIAAAGQTLNSIALNSFGKQHMHDANRKQNNFMPSAKLQYFQSQDAMYYATIGTGIKSGGFNAAEQLGDEDKFEFDEEKSVAFELGAKYQLLDGQLQLNGDLFVTKFDDLQVSTFDGFTFQVTNAAKATTQGLELDATFRATQSILLGGAFSYTDATYDDFENAACTFVQKVEYEAVNGPFTGRNCPQDLSGSTMMYAPEVSSSLWVQHNVKIGADFEITSSLDVNYSDEYNLAQDTDELDRQDAFSKINAHLVLRNLVDEWEVAVIARNLTDELTYVRSTDIPLVENGAHVAATGQPRTLAAQFKMYF